MSKNSTGQNQNSALLLAGSVDDRGDDTLEIVGEGCRVSHDVMLCFPTARASSIASILIVPGDELRMIDELPGGGWQLP